MLIAIGFACLMKLVLANYLIIKDFRNGQRILYLNIVKISSTHCFGPIFNLKSQSLCENPRNLRLTRMSTMYKRVFDVLSENQSRVERAPSCPMVISRRYNCSIELQMSNANRLDFKSVIYTTANSSFISDIVHFAATNPLFTASLIMISVKDGEKLLNITNSKFCYAQISGTDLSAAIMMTYIFILGVAALVFYGVLKVTSLFTTLWRRIRHYINLKISLSNLEIMKFKAGDFEDSCSICLIEFSATTKIRKLTCGHGFHPKCIDHWIRSHKPTCPLCNQAVDIPRIAARVKCSICTFVVSNGSGTVVQEDEDSHGTVITTANVAVVDHGNEMSMLDIQLDQSAVARELHGITDERSRAADFESEGVEFVSLYTSHPRVDVREGIIFTEPVLEDETV